MAAKDDLFLRYQSKRLLVRIVKPPAIDRIGVPNDVVSWQARARDTKNIIFYFALFNWQKSLGYSGRVQPGPRLTVSHGVLTDNR